VRPWASVWLSVILPPLAALLALLNAQQAWGRTAFFCRYSASINNASLAIGMIARYLIVLVVVVQLVVLVLLHISVLMWPETASWQHCMHLGTGVKCTGLLLHHCLQSGYNHIHT
jgi:hypothetical protein